MNVTERAIRAWHMYEHPDCRPGPVEECASGMARAAWETYQAEQRDANPDCKEPHGPHVPINIGSKTRDRLRTYLMNEAPRGQGFTGFIDAALDALEANIWRNNR